MASGTIVVASGTLGTKALREDYPVAEGITAGTTKHPKEYRLVAEESNTSGVYGMSDGLQ